MATFNGDYENLVFRCKACAFQNEIEIDLDNKKDKDNLWHWLRIHSAEGGDYINRKIVRKNCKLCEEDIDGTHVIDDVNNTICKRCAKSITKHMMEDL